MSKLLLTVAGVAVLAGGVMAQKGKTPDKIQCAVMNDKMVDIKAATASKMYSDYKGKRYFFCCGGCPEAFKKDPAKYAKSKSIPTPKDKGKA